MSQSKAENPIGVGDDKKMDAVQGFMAGILGATVLATGIGVVLTILFSPIRALRLGKAIQFVTGLEVDNPQSSREFLRLAKWGTGIGYGMIAGISSINWAVEQWDRISGETAEVSTPRNENSHGGGSA